MKSLLKMSLAIASLVLLTACGSDNDHSSGNDSRSHEQSGSSNMAEAATITATGTVISVPPNKRNVIVRHAKIPGFMDAMTMPFAVKDSTVLAGIAAKDSIRFVIDTTGTKIRLTEIQKINE